MYLKSFPEEEVQVDQEGKVNENQENFEEEMMIDQLEIQSENQEQDHSTHHEKGKNSFQSFPDTRVTDLESVEESSIQSSYDIDPPESSFHRVSSRMLGVS